MKKKKNYVLNQTWSLNLLHKLNEIKFNIHKHTLRSSYTDTN